MIFFIQQTEQATNLFFIETFERQKYNIKFISLFFTNP